MTMLATGTLERVNAEIPPQSFSGSCDLAAPAPSASLAGWTLAIDFGTTYTVAAVVSTDGSARLVDLEGDGSSKMPSSVIVIEDGTLVVGRAAVRQSVLYPASFEPTPKRLVGQGSVLLGESLVPVVDLVAAVLRHAGDEARRQQGGTGPDRVLLTHPAKWAGPRLDLLTEAGRLAGLGDVQLLAEPVAAASRIGAAGAAGIELGQRIAVYDFGGGTFDAAVLIRTASGFQVAGDPGGRDPLGGEDLDERILRYLGDGPLGELPEWQLLMTSPEASWRRHRSDLRRRVREAKEDLSKAMACTLWIPGIERDYQLSRTELDALIEADVRMTLDELDATIAAAEMQADELAGIYLVGGSSRICLVTEMIRERFGTEPAHFEDPKAIVALGGATIASRTRSPRPGSGCRLGAYLPVAPKAKRRIEHWLSAGSTVVHSVPNRWASTESYAAAAVQDAYLRGLTFSALQWGRALGTDGALLFTSAGADGRTYLSSYQVIGYWAVHASWPQDEPVEVFQACVDPAQWCAERPPILVLGDEVVEKVTVTDSVGGMPVVATAHCASVSAVDWEYWLELFLARLIQQRPGARVSALRDGIFGDGHACRVAQLRGAGSRGSCWYGVVEGRGVSVTVEAAVPVPARTALRVRDGIALFLTVDQMPSPSPRYVE